MVFDYHISTYVLMALGGCLAMCLGLCLYYCPPLLRLARFQRECNRSAADIAPDVPASASIVVYSRDDLSGLELLLPQLLGQQYAGRFEVIVVNEGESPEVRDFIDLQQITHRNLYLTHTPDGARSLSRKKLALTLGVKAARNEVIVITTANSTIESDRWLAQMLQPFNDDASLEVVLGAGVPHPGDDTRWGCRRRSFDFAADTATWLSAALRSRPYRGSEHNLAYRRDLFFNNKGFSRSLNMRFGDDDIFVNEICRSDNTAVQLSDDSIVSFNAEYFRSGYGEEAVRRAFTGRFIPKGARRRMAFGPWAMWLWMACAAAALWLDLYNWLTVGIVAVTGLTSLILVSVSWTAVLKTLKSRQLLLTVPYLLMTRPLRLTYYKLRSRMNRRSHYTWV